MSITDKTRGKVVSGKSQIVGTGAVSGTGVTALEGTGETHTTVINFSGTAITLTDNLTKLHGGVGFYTFPEGSILIHGATANLDIVASGGIVTAGEGDFGVGVIVADAAAALNTTDQNIIPSTAFTCSSFAATCHGRNAADIAPLDGSATAVPLFLNWVVDNGDYVAGGVITVTGTITVVWHNLGDY